MCCPDRPYVVFLCSSRTVWENETHLVTSVADALVREFGDEAPTLVVRPHPTNPTPFDAYSHPRVVIYPRGGDQAAVADGNRALLFREQHDIIDRFYLEMLGHGGLEGSAFTYLLTLAGAPSVPGAHSYPERYPLTIAARLPLRP